MIKWLAELEAEFACSVKIAVPDQAARHVVRTGTHCYYAPHAALSRDIAHYTLTLGSVGETKVLTLIPDASGCLVYTLNAGHASGKVWGATTMAATVQNAGDQKKVRLFVEFLPGGLRRLTGMSQTELTDRKLDTADVDAALHRAILEVAEGSSRIAELMDRLDGIFLPRLDRSQPSLPAVYAVERMRAAGGCIRVCDLAASLYYSERQLNRILNDSVGMGAKTLARLFRINGALQKIGGVQSLTELSVGAGYYDQSHFIHDFRSVVGVSPGEYRADMSGFYNEIFKF